MYSSLREYLLRVKFETYMSVMETFVFISTPGSYLHTPIHVLPNLFFKYYISDLES